MSRKTTSILGAAVKRGITVVLDVAALPPSAVKTLKEHGYIVPGTTQFDALVTSVGADVKMVPVITYKAYLDNHAPLPGQNAQTQARSPVTGVDEKELVDILEKAQFSVSPLKTFTIVEDNLTKAYADLALEALAARESGETASIDGTTEIKKIRLAEMKEGNIMRLNSQSAVAKTEGAAGREAIIRGFGGASESNPGSRKSKSLDRAMHFYLVTRVDPMGFFAICLSSSYKKEEITNMDKKYPGISKCLIDIEPYKIVNPTNGKLLTGWFFTGEVKFMDHDKGFSLIREFDGKGFTKEHLDEIKHKVTEAKVDDYAKTLLKETKTGKPEAGKEKTEA